MDFWIDTMKFVLCNDNLMCYVIEELTKKTRKKMTLQKLSTLFVPHSKSELLVEKTENLL